MTGQPNGPWWRALPALETWVPCGPDMHPVRWQDGDLRLPAHPDAEGELVLAALGGEQAACIELATAWHRHAGDLRVLAVGPRGPADRVNVSWDDVRDFRSGPQRKGQPRSGMGRPVPYSQPLHRPGPPVAASRVPRHPIPVSWTDELGRVQAARLEVLSLLALGPMFQMVLSGAVAAAWSGGGPRAHERDAHRAALEAALTGRLAPAAAGWLGIDPDQVDARLHEDAGWGSLELTGTGEARHLRAALPAEWLATVWACGLTVTGGHLVVAVEHAAWPDATVLAVPEPGRDPVVLSVRASEDASQNADQNAGPSGDRAHWEVTGVQPAACGEPDEPDEPAGSSRGKADSP